MARKKNPVRGMITMLVVMFFLGMALNSIGQPTQYMPNWLRLTAVAFVALHVLVALGIIANAIVIIKRAGHSRVARLARAGGASIGFSFLAGIVTIISTSQTLTAVSSFLMAGGFILALLAYGQIYLRQNAVSSAIAQQRH